MCPAMLCVPIQVCRGCSRARSLPARGRTTALALPDNNRFTEKKSLSWFALGKISITNIGETGIQTGNTPEVRLRCAFAEMDVCTTCVFCTFSPSVRIATASKEITLVQQVFTYIMTSLCNILATSEHKAFE